MSGMVLLSVLLCFCAGGAIDTGSICVVRAVNEAISGRWALALGCLATLLIASSVFTVDTLAGWHLRTPAWAWPTLRTAAGAAVFALGAVINGACAVGTITRLCRGDIGYAATLVGAFAVTFLIPRTLLPTAQTAGEAISGLEWFLVILAATLIPMLILRRHLTRRIILSYAALGLIAAELANLQGDWTWLRLLQEISAGLPIRYEILICIAAVLVGATVTAVFRHHFRFVRPDPRNVLRETLGGGLMAAGAILIPGGNDLLLVYGLPSGSPHAVVAYAITIALMLLLLRLFSTARRWVIWPIP